MSHILYSSIARAGGIDLLLGIEAVSHPPLRPVRRRRNSPARLLRLRRRTGRGLVELGQLFLRWGADWAAATPYPTAATNLKLVR